jgi:hypothetical protein
MRSDPRAMLAGAREEVGRAVPPADDRRPDVRHIRAQDPPEPRHHRTLPLLVAHADDRQRSCLEVSDLLAALANDADRIDVVGVVLSFAKSSAVAQVIDLSA